MTMSSPARVPSSPPKGASVQEELAYWKAQYDQVEVELQEFQASSKELEAELEKDIERSEHREHQLRERAEKMAFEADEWKNKYRQSKAETGNALTQLQKEITTLRESNRSMQLQLRDIEVQNDDFEKQARHQTSSLEDLDSKYNIAIERGVLLEEEIKNSEQEREQLRIQSQHLKDELSDLKVELEIVQSKLGRAEKMLEHERVANSSSILNHARPRSRQSETSASVTTLSSPLLATPPRLAVKSNASMLHSTPPSPPLSDASLSGLPKKKSAPPMTPMLNKPKALASHTPRLSDVRPPRHSRLPSISYAAPGQPIAPRASKARLSHSSQNPPNELNQHNKHSQNSQSSKQNQQTRQQQQHSATSSRSLHQVRGLISKMQKLEERVQTARSKLPPPAVSPAKGSPRNNALKTTDPCQLPSNITVRSARKRPSQSSFSSLGHLSMPASNTSTHHSAAPDHIPRPSSELGSASAGFVAPLPQASLTMDLPNRPESRTSGTITPSSFIRPSSRSSISTCTAPSRPRSSVSGSCAGTRITSPLPRASTPGPKYSMSRSFSTITSNIIEESGTPHTIRRTGNIPTPTARRKSSAAALTNAKRQGCAEKKDVSASPGAHAGVVETSEMRPPASVKYRTLSGVGETF